MTIWESLGAPGGLGINTAPSTGEEQWGNLEDSLEEAKGYLLFDK